MAVKTDDAFPVRTVSVDIEGRDLGGYVRDAQRVVATGLVLPRGYTVAWSGQFEFMERVRQRLKLVVPVTLGIIFLLLYLNFRSVAETLMVMLALPFALVGGVWSLWALGYNTSVAVWVGFIALAGVATETGVVWATRSGRTAPRPDRVVLVDRSAGRRSAPLASVADKGGPGGATDLPVGSQA